MSKKQTQKKKVTVKVMAGEAVFVAEMETLRHIMDTYAEMARLSKDRSEINYYNNIVNEISDWTTKTYFSGQANDEEEW